MEHLPSCQAGENWIGTPSASEKNMQKINIAKTCLAEVLVFLIITALLGCGVNALATGNAFEAFTNTPVVAMAADTAP